MTQDSLLLATDAVIGTGRTEFEGFDETDAGRCELLADFIDDVCAYWDGGGRCWRRRVADADAAGGVDE